MDNNKKQNTQNTNKNKNLTANNDQLGENASEEYRSENYDNAKNRSQK